MHFRSKFPLSYHLFNTARFGEYTPHFVFDGVAGDHVNVRSAHNVRSYTLGAPLLQNIDMKKDYFMVPMEAILPLNWEKVFTNPLLGDDVQSNVNCVCDGFGILATNIISKSIANAIVKDTWGEDYMNAVFHMFPIVENLISDGSLLATLGCHLSPYVTFTRKSDSAVFNWDEHIELVLSGMLNDTTIFGSILEWDIDGTIYRVAVDPALSDRIGKDMISWRTFFSLIRDAADFHITNNSVAPINQYDSDALETYMQSMYQTGSSAPWDIQYQIPSDLPLNFARLAAYQMVCHHYYSNDRVDFIYSAELFRQVMTYFAENGSGLPQFTYNGVPTYYDALSGKCMYDCLAALDDYIQKLNAPGGSTANHNDYFYFMNLFSFRRSLRFLDYFTGSKTQPLAVGNVDVSVVANTVNVVDVTRNIQKQRFLNAVNRAGRKFNQYLTDIFNSSPAPDYHNPFFLAHTNDTIFGSEVENTGAAQLTDRNSVTTTLRSNGSRYAFDFDLDRPAVVIGISYFDLTRNYPNTIERSFFHKDRFDMFNPYFQFIGDQDVKNVELGIVRPGYGMNYTDVFGYTLRNMEYKQRYNQLAGGFAKMLPGYVFISDDNRLCSNMATFTINPDYIRSLASELDKYYVSLTGYGLASYFHFIIDNFNDVVASRPMAYAPSIL